MAQTRRYSDEVSTLQDTGQGGRKNQDSSRHNFSSVWYVTGRFEGTHKLFPGYLKWLQRNNLFDKSTHARFQHGDESQSNPSESTKQLSFEEALNSGEEKLKEDLILREWLWLCAEQVSHLCLYGKMY